MANPVGRPPKYKTPEEMEKAINAYFEEIKENNEPPTVSGLSLFLGFMDRRSLLDYLENKTEFTRTIKEAKSRIEIFLEKQLASGKNVAGLIFNLKNNFGWVDKQEIDSTIKGEISLSDILAKGKQADNE